MNAGPRGDRQEGAARLGLRRGLDRLAAGDLAAARRLLDYAHRCDPDDRAAAMARAQLMLRQGDPAAVPAFRALAESADLREAWFGLAAALLDAGLTEPAQAALAAALARHAPSRDEAVLACCDRIAAARPDAVGWCGLTGEGMLVVTPACPGPLAATLDGVPVALPAAAVPGQRVAVRLPEAWRAAVALDVHLAGTALVGSPLRPAAIGRVEGFVAAREGGIEGWARLPADADAEVALTLELAESVPRVLRVGSAGFRLEAASLPAGLIALRGPDGRELLGSPLDPGAEARAAAAVAQAAAARRGGRRPAEAVAFAEATPAWADLRGPAPAVGTSDPPADVVIAVHDGGDAVLACLESVLPTLPAGSRAIVVDDASTDAGLVGHLRDLAASGRIRLLRRGQQGGFPAAANAGLRAARGHDAVLLNSDTLVAPGWLEGLRAAAYAATDIGSATPFSNDATILSFPEPGRERGAGPGRGAAAGGTGGGGEWRGRGGDPDRGRASASISSATAWPKWGFCGRTRSRRATARRTISACAPGIWAGGTWRPRGSMSGMSGRRRSGPRSGGRGGRCWRAISRC